MQARWIFGLFILVLFSAGGFYFYKSGQTPSLTPHQGQNTAAAQENTLLDERSLGDPNAPITIIEYASMTCNHCANFHNDTLPLLKRDYIDTGKARLVFRDFPLNMPALKAAMLARCAPQDLYFQLVEVIFANQERWAFSEDPVGTVSQLARLAGLSADEIDACLQNQELENALLQSIQTAQNEWQINSTPSFIINDGAARFAGNMAYDELKKILDDLLP